MAIRAPIPDLQTQWTTAQVMVTVQFTRQARQAGPSVQGKPLAIPANVSDRMEQFTGRAWLLPPILDWLEQGKERIFLLTGEPGSGKSMFVAWLAGYGPMPAGAAAAEQLARVRSQTAAVHFCQSTYGNISPQIFVENMANQLAANLPGFDRALFASLGGSVEVVQNIAPSEGPDSVAGVHIDHLNLGNMPDEAAFMRALIQPLQELYRSGYDRMVLLMVDALDEVNTYTGSPNLVQLLSRLDDLPSGVRILATTRNDPSILRSLYNSRRFDLVSDTPAQVDDIQAYVLNRLSQTTSLDASASTALASQVAGAAGGNFLYAARLLDELEPDIAQGSLSTISTVLLPSSLNNLYSSYLNRAFGKDEALLNMGYKSFRLLLGLLAVAQGDGLTRTQLMRITGQEVDQALSRIQQFLDGSPPEGPFHIYHRSFVDFLLSASDNSDYHIDAAEMHQRIADYYWNTYRGDWTRSDDYGLRWLDVHVRAAGQPDRLKELLGGDWARVRRDRRGAP